MTDNDCVDTGGHNCDEALERLYEYLDEEMDEVTAEGIRSHLEGCSPCNTGFDFERRLKVVVRERLSEVVPDGFLVKLRKALDDEAATHH